MDKRLVIKQTDMKDCGACCLLSLIKYYDGLISLEKLKMDTLTSKNGTTAYHLVETLKKYGFDSYGINLEFTDLIQDNIVLPVIAHVTVFEKYLHFVVIYKINLKKELITIMDPAYGYRDLTFKEFQDIWNKFLIIAFPISKVPKVTHQNSLFKYYLKKLIIQKNILKQLFSCYFVMIITSIICSFYFKISINTINNFRDFKSLIILFVLFSFFHFFKVISTYLKNYFENYLNKNLDIHIFCPFLRHIFYLPLNYVKSKTSGEIMTRISELNIIKDTFSKVILTLTFDLLLTLATFIILFKLNVFLTSILFVIATFYILVALVFKNPLYDIVVKNRELEADFNTKVIEGINSINTIKNLNYEDKENKIIEYSLIKYLKNSLNLKKIIDMQELIKDFILEIGLFILISIGFYMYFKNKISLLNLITFESLYIYIINPLKNIVSLIPSINFIKSSLTKVLEFFEYEEEDLINVDEKINGNIEFKNVSFSYNNYNQIIKNFNLKISKGEKILLLGKSGSGKSTLCKLLCRFINGKGEILINEININDINLSKLRNSITYVSQKEKLFSDTIMNNICFDKKYSEKYLFDIIKICRLEHVISNHPLRLNQMLVEGGANLSGGERQRIILARALIKNNDIIILDEALSEVDEKLESEIVKDLIKKYPDKTLIYVTHKNQKKLFERSIYV